ncbi:hypothetical protein D3C71_1577550 [compost metagenome]
MGVHLRVVAHRTAAEVGGDRTRGDGVDADAARAQFLGEIAREHFHAPLHHRVRGIAREAEACQARRGIDDAPAVGDQGQQLLRQEERALEVHVDQHVELRFGGLGKRRIEAHAGVVHQTVELFALPGVDQRRLHIFSERRKALAVAHIEAQRHGAAAQGLDLRHDLLRRAGVVLVGDDQLHALGRQMQRGAAAQAAAGAGDQGNTGGG